MRDAARTDVRLWVAAALGTLAAWAYTIRSADTMSSTMPMPGGWSMSMAGMSMGGQSSTGHAAMFVTMWTVMMIAMMLPSIMPACSDAFRAHRPAHSCSNWRDTDYCRPLPADPCQAGLPAPLPLSARVLCTA